MISMRIRQLVDYALKKGLIEKSDETWAINSLLGIMGEDEYSGAPATDAPLEEILGALCDVAEEKGIIEGGTVSRDLFDTKLMGVLTPRPSDVISKFEEQKKESPKKSTDLY